MGKVVDSSFRVKGVSGLRVADASVFPVAIGGHPQATLYGIAEQGCGNDLARRVDDPCKMVSREPTLTEV